MYKSNLPPQIVTASYILSNLLSEGKHENYENVLQTVDAIHI